MREDCLKLDVRLLRGDVFGPAKVLGPERVQAHQPEVCMRRLELRQPALVMPVRKG